MSKIRLMRILVIFVFLYACETWTLTAELQKQIQALEMRCYCKILNILYRDHITNKEVRNRIQRATGPYDDLLTIVKRRKLKWYGHVTRSTGLGKTILQGHCTRKEERWTEIKIGKQHQRVDGLDLH
jgi:hypothetical protein